MQDPPENDEVETEEAAPFMWGVTSSSVQVEGVHPAADWSHWERDKTAPESSDGNGFATNFHDDLALIASLGVTDVRLTIEWARVEPVEGKIDGETLERYADVVGHAASLGLTALAHPAPHFAAWLVQRRQQRFPRRTRPRVPLDAPRRPLRRTFR